MHAKNVLGLGERHAVSLLKFADFAHRMAAMAPVPDKKLPRPVRREREQIPVDASGRMFRPWTPVKVKCSTGAQSETLPSEGSAPAPTGSPR